MPPWNGLMPKLVNTGQLVPNQISWFLWSASGICSLFCQIVRSSIGRCESEGQATTRVTSAYTTRSQSGSQTSQTVSAFMVTTYYCKLQCLCASIASFHHALPHVASQTTIRECASTARQSSDQEETWPGGLTRHGPRTKFSFYK